MKRLRIFSSTGDTIVEVMIVLAVLGLAFGIAYATASKGLIRAQNAQEHSQALEQLKTQVELVHSAISKYSDSSTNWLRQNDIHTATDSFCMDGTQPTKVKTVSGVRNCTSGTNDLYKDSITYHDSTPGQEYYTFTATWDGLGSMGKQQEQLTYKMHQIASDSFSSTLQPMQIQVVVKSVPPVAGNVTPSCDSPATQNIGGTQVKLTGPGFSETQSTDGATSSTTFQGLTGGATYTATGISAPNEYELCAPASGTNSTTAVNDQLKTISGIKIRPICKPIWQQIGSHLVQYIAGYTYIPTYTWEIVSYTTTSTTTYVDRGWYAWFGNLFYDYGSSTSYHTYTGLSRTGHPGANYNYYHYVITYTTTANYGYVHTGGYYQPIYGYYWVADYGWVNHCPPY